MAGLRERLAWQWCAKYTAVKSKYVPPAEAKAAELLATAAKFAQKTTAAPIDTAAEDVMVCAKFLSLHSNAKARSKDFDLSIADVRKLLKTKRCAYTGEVLTKAKQSPPNNSDRTIDRLDSDKGYVKGNVFAVSHYANSLKNALFEKPPCRSGTACSALLYLPRRLHGGGESRPVCP